METKADELSKRMLGNAGLIIGICTMLNRSIAQRHIAKQLVRSGTSAGANYEEARGAESRTDFLHKLQIVLKELRETVYWLRLAAHFTHIPKELLEKTLADTTHLTNIIAKSIKTAKANKNTKK